MTKRQDIMRSKYLAGCIKRYSTWPMIHSQTVGHHCWRVACIFVEVFGLPRAEVLYYCLHHDSGELFAGDLPYGAKSGVPGLKEKMVEAESIGLKNLNIQLPEITEEERIKIKICDLLEMWETGMHEQKLGNSYADPIVNDTMVAVRQLAMDSSLTQHLDDWFWSRRNQ